MFLKHKVPARRAWVEAARADYLRTLEPVPAPGALNMSEVMALLRERLPEDAIVANGAGNFATWPHRFWQYTRYRSQLAPTSGAMGYGVPAAIAAKIVQPERTVVCFAGDGDFLMSGQELATAVRERADVLFLVVDNGMYGTIRMHQEREYPGRVVGTEPDESRLRRVRGVVRRPRRARRADGGVRARARAGARSGRPGAAASARRPGGDHASHNPYRRAGGHGRPRANRDRMRLLPAIALAALALAGCGSEDADEAGSTLPATTEAVTETQPATTVTETETEPPRRDRGEAAVLDVGPAADAAGAGSAGRPWPTSASASSTPRSRATTTRSRRSRWSRARASRSATAAARTRPSTGASVEEDSSEQPKPMRALATILTLPFTRNESGSYAWPTAYNESPTEDDWQALVDSGLYDADVIDQMQTQGTGYLGYRTAITPDGDWQFFVAGD